MACEKTEIDFGYVAADLRSHLIQGIKSSQMGERTGNNRKTKLSNNRQRCNHPIVQYFCKIYASAAQQQERFIDHYVRNKGT